MKINKYLKECFAKDGTRVSPKLSSGIKNFIIDIDGVICEDVPNEEPERMVNAKEIPNARKQINKWYREGHLINFFTSRTKNLKKITENWLKKHKFKYHNIIFEKPRGGNYHYIDDKQVRATKFDGRFGKFVHKKHNIQVFE